MPAVGIKIGEARMTPYGWNVVRRTWAETGPVLHRLAVLPIRKDFPHPPKQAVTRLYGGGLVEADIFQRASDQHVPIATRNQIQIFLEKNLLKWRSIKLEQQYLPAYRADVHVERVFAQQGLAPRSCRNDVGAGNQPALR